MQSAQEKVQLLAQKIAQTLYASMNQEQGSEQEPLNDEDVDDNIIDAEAV